MDTDGITFAVGEHRPGEADRLCVSLGMRALTAAVDGKLPFAVERDGLLCLNGTSEDEEKDEEREEGHGYE